jgi:hypothetical protein
MRLVSGLCHEPVTKWQAEDSFKVWHFKNQLLEEAFVRIVTRSVVMVCCFFSSHSSVTVE